MTDRYSAFRLNFEQQQKRAKDLLKAARAGERTAIARFRGIPPKLAEAQSLIADELRFESWAALKRHIAEMGLAREAMNASAPDNVARAPVFTRSPGLDRDGKVRPPWTDVLAITELGRAVLRADVDFRSLNPPKRWVGGVEIASNTADWRWDEQLRDAVLWPRSPSRGSSRP